MNKNSKIFWGVLILGLAIIGAVVYLYVLKKSNLDLTNDNNEEKTSTSNNEAANTKNIEGYRTKEELPPFPTGFDRINYGPKILSEIGPEQRKKQEDNFKELLDKIEKNPDSLDLWVGLGLIKNVFEDYAGARDVWEYASVIRPANAVSFNNLGGLYWHYFKDYPKAEENYRKAISNMPENPGLYKDLSDMYKYSYREKAGLADDVLLEALQKNPGNVQVLIWLGDYYKTTDKAKARQYFTEALKIDPENFSIKKELDSLN
ncbi:hypothetical protein HYW53_03275 [Candidatus Giovannonibacteria bacterium]|nr:hypothetical protein [Candidatus Giovannonibacteria bacterium]